MVGDFDLLYISHIHPDHYGSESIHELFSFYGTKQILIADRGNDPNCLSKKIWSDSLGSSLHVANEMAIGDTKLKTIPNSTGSISDIDSALIVSLSKSKLSVLNINDCLMNEYLCSAIKKYKADEDLESTLFCLGYTGAGPYPQTYYSTFTDESKLLEKANAKKQQFFDRYSNPISSISSSRRLPFAGKYVLKGDLSFLNKYRGVADALEVKDFDPGAIVLADGGEAYFDLETLEISKERDYFYQNPDNVPTDEDYYWRTAVGFLPNSSHLKRLLIKAIANAHSKSECLTDCLWTIHIYDNPSDLLEILNNPTPCDLFKELLTFNCNKSADPIKDINKDPKCHAHMFIEAKALFAVLTGITHSNNYEVGSVKQVRRFTDVFVSEMNSYLNFLSVI